MASVLLPAGETNLASLASLNSNKLVIQGGNQTVSGTLDQSGLAAGIDTIDFQSGAAVSFMGTAGAALKAKILTTMRLAGNGGTMRYTPCPASGGGAAAGDCARIQGLGGVNLQIVSGGASTVAKLEWNAPGARVDIDDSSLVDVLALVAGLIDQQYNATGNVTWRVGGGSFTTARGWSGTGLPTTTGGAAIIGGSASVTVSRTDNFITSLPTGGDVIIGGTASLIYRGGNVTGIYATGGAFLDFRDVPAAMTITNLIATADVIRRSYLKSRGGSNLVTITNTQILGGTIDAIQQ